MIEDQLINRREAIALLNVSFAEFKKMIEHGRVPPGDGPGPKRLRWPRSEILKARLPQSQRHETQRAA